MPETLDHCLHLGTQMNFIRDIVMLNKYERHGLSYTTFSLSDLSIVGAFSSDSSFSARVLVNVTNTGSVAGSEVVQLYLALPANGTITPKLQLKGFAKVRDIAPGQCVTAVIALDKYAVSFWDTLNNSWKAVGGEYEVHVGTSSDNLSLKGLFKIKENFSWIGL